MLRLGGNPFCHHFRSSETTKPAVAGGFFLRGWSKPERNMPGNILLNALNASRCAAVSGASLGYTQHGNNFKLKF